MKPSDYAPNEPLPDWTPMDVRERIEDAERCSEHLLRVGAIVRTSYGTGPYRIINITDICRCPNYLDVINLHNDAPESEPHHHLTCVDAEPMPGRNPNTKSWLNGYRLDGTSVWTDDRLIFDGMAPDAALEPEIPKQKSAKPKPGKAPESQLDLFELLSLTN